MFGGYRGTAVLPLGTLIPSQGFDSCLAPQSQFLTILPHHRYIFLHMVSRSEEIILASSSWQITVHGSDHAWAPTPLCAHKNLGLFKPQQLLMMSQSQ